VSPAPATAIAWAGETDGVGDGAAAVVVDLRRISPELVLVSPELRGAALALLPERDPDGWIPRPYTPPRAPVVELVAETEPPPPPSNPADVAGELVVVPSATGRALAAAAVVYTGQSILGAAIAGAGLVTATVALAGLADIVHP